jgi:hypothetical protein
MTGVTVKGAVNFSKKLMNRLFSIVQFSKDFTMELEHLDATRVNYQLLGDHQNYPSMAELN